MLFSYQNLPGNFAEICSKLFDGLVHSGGVVFSTDQYLPGSVKSLERKRRGCGEKLIIGGGATKRPAEWKLFLANEDNKVQLIRLLLKLWSGNEYAAKLQARQVTVICEGSAYLLTSDDGITTQRTELPMLASTQEETDSRVILYTMHAQSKGYHYVRIKSPDSDIFFILLHFAPQLNIKILFDTKIDKKPRLIDVSSIGAEFGQEKCTALLGLHGFTGCDTVSAFRGKGKLTPMKKLLKTTKLHPILGKLGNSWGVSEELLEEMEIFTCSLYGGTPNVTKVNDLRLSRINKLCTKEGRSTPSSVDMSTLPPCRRSLKQHILRANYQIAIWKRANIAKPRIPSVARDHGWVMTKNGVKPLWYEGECQPQHLEDISEEPNTDTESDEESEFDISSDLDSGSDHQSDTDSDYD